MTEKCCCSAGQPVMLIACSGASNVGQITNDVAVELTKEGFGRMFCLAGVGGDIGGFVRSAKDAENIIVLDGCSIGCACAVLDRHRIKPSHHVLITNLGIEKGSLSRQCEDSVQMAKDHIRALCSSLCCNASPAEAQLFS